MKIFKSISLIVLTALTATAFGMERNNTNADPDNNNANNNNAYHAAEQSRVPSLKDLTAKFVLDYKDDQGNKLETSGLPIDLQQELAQKLLAQNPDVVPNILSKNLNPTKLAISPDGLLAISLDFGADAPMYTIKVWCLPTGTCIRRFTSHPNFINGIVINDRNALISYCGGETQVLDIINNSCKVINFNSKIGINFLFSAHTAKIQDLHSLLSLKHHLENNLTFKQAQLLIPIHAAMQAQEKGDRNTKHTLNQEEREVFNQLPDAIKDILQQYITFESNNNNNNDNNNNNNAS